MRKTIELIYFKEADRYTYRPHIERERGNEHLLPADVAAEVQEIVEEVMERGNTSARIIIRVEVDE